MPGGWSTSKVDRVKTARVPDILKCIGCNRNRPQAAYSGAQITRLKERVAFKGPEAIATHPLRCRQCTGGEAPVEITCVRCNKRKSVDQYTKAQRRNFDTATCRNCVSDQMMARPWEEEQDKKDIREEELALDTFDENASTTVASIAGGVSLENDEDDGVTDAGSMYTRPSLPSFVAEDDVDDDDDDDDDEEGSIAGGVFLESGSIHGNSSSVRSAQNGTRAVAGWGCMVEQADYEEDGWQYVEKKLRSKPNALPVKSNRWAKIKAHDPDRNAYLMRVPETEGFDTDIRDEFEGSVSHSGNYY